MAPVKAKLTKAQTAEKKTRTAKAKTATAKTAKAAAPPEESPAPPPPSSQEQKLMASAKKLGDAIRALDPSEIDGRVMPHLNAIERAERGLREVMGWPKAGDHPDSPRSD